jgi:hypothetical protein
LKEEFRRAGIGKEMVRQAFEHRWRDILESGAYATVRDLAKAEAINESYLGRVLRLTLLAPSIIEAILECTQPANLELDEFLRQFSVKWDEQLEKLTMS